MTENEIQMRFEAIAGALGCLRSGQSAHLKKDHGNDIEKEFRLLHKRLSRIEAQLGINDHGLQLQRLRFADPPGSTAQLMEALKAAPRGEETEILEQDTPPVRRSRGRPRKNM